MWTLIKLVHLASAIVWMGGMAFMLYALRPAIGMLTPPQPANRLRAAAASGAAYPAIWAGASHVRGLRSS